jgi:hypothetical protein
MLARPELERVYKIAGHRGDDFFCMFADYPYVRPL